MNDIKPELSVKKFFEIYFPPLYSQYFELIWDTYRNGHIHLFRPKYYKHFPTDPKKDGIWTKYNLSELIFGVLYTELDKLDNTETFERIKNKHLHINIIADKKNSIHYVFYLCPQMVYKDLLIGIKKYKRDLHKKRALQKQFLMGNKIYTQSTRLEWGKDRKYSRIESKLEKEAQTKLTSFNKLEGMIYKD
ncbi:hypothetical protein JW962_02565 [Candidatus Dojkabacteria bacterium]|nr:hypothetical protein [Candidatus Dojkabacteria bacterium]